jgi:hypothetical protein
MKEQSRGYWQDAYEKLDKYLKDRNRRLTARKSPWNILNLVFLLVFGWFFVFKVLPMGFKLVWLFIPKDAFTFIFPEGELSQFIWPLFYVFGGMLAALPIILVLVNLVEMLIPWARKAFEKDAENEPEIGFKGATMGLLKLIPKITLPLIPVILFGLLRFYYIDPAGVHLFQWPDKTVNYPWTSVRGVVMEAWGDSEKQYGYHMRYKIHMADGRELVVSWKFIENTGDHEVAESYMKISRIIKDIPSVKVKTNVTQLGMEFLKAELGDGARDVLLRPAGI